MAIQITMQDIIDNNPCNIEGPELKGFFACLLARPDLDWSEPRDIASGYAHSTHEEVVWTIQGLPEKYYREFVLYACWCVRRILTEQDTALLRVLECVEGRGTREEAVAALTPVAASTKRHALRMLLRAFDKVPLHRLVGSVSLLCWKSVQNERGTEAGQVEREAQVARFKKLLEEEEWLV